MFSNFLHQNILASFSRSFHGNNKYLAKRVRKKPKRLFTPMETLHSLKQGRKWNVRYTDQFGIRSSKFVPVSKLEAPRWNWDYDLTDSNRDFLHQLSRDQQKEIAAKSDNEPLNDDQWPLLPWQPGSIRIGVVGVKIGTHPIWFKDGSWATTTLIQLQDCHVVHHMTSEEYNGRDAAAIVGCKNASPFYRNEKYAEYCNRAGVPLKTKCFRFIMTDNAAVKPGTRLDVTHFRPGQYVDCLAKTVGYGFQGVIQRFHHAGGPSDARGSHGWHRRTGSIGSRTGKVVKGKKMPGQLGGTYESSRGLKVLRLNTKYNVMYVKGRIPGHINQFVKVQDSSLHKYRPKNEEEAKILSGFVKIQ